MEKTMDKIVALAKARGFVYPGSEIYGGLANTWDYGNLGVELKNNVSSISIYTDSYNSNSAEGIIIFSELSLVKGINPKLSYQFDSLHENDALATLLADIQKAGVADTFYYNAPIDNENAIDLNNNLANETLLTPEAWYDPNNVNNKFVVSEISADDLLTGVTLSKASRL